MTYWAVAGVLLITVAVMAVDVPRMWRKRMRKELAVYGFLLAFGLGISLMEALMMPLPNPLDWITYVFQPMSNLIYGSLK